MAGSMRAMRWLASSGAIRPGSRAATRFEIYDASSPMNIQLTAFILFSALTQALFDGNAGLVSIASMDFHSDFA
ncbi:hypothetical protein D3C72_1696750 [compost metagenome]